ncbi:Mo-co oxidoreductase dimerization domain protein [Janthinobacterium sp. HH103]|uniref:Ig-like domain-containing protein n=1 Tax=unclassified Janthinobacterium TaxID=2610881 RepID=UPI000875991E|nr:MULTISPECIES: Ig-like domain-containing protein [unclassified Janthinobacterium]OEZ64928.1 Mo-co oxidoreductase dimerization domain protein [Janthinobacterium sp. HH100]OEZ79685.1 Mo-co oxidoreductase dimerization domain protein [Janthinobacterium sp. HH103]QOU75219.1 hypothetical protein JAB4_047010 [Janthinobacterium sp. HH102]
MNHSLFPAAATTSVRRPLRRASQLLPLEQRFMFDGAVADAAHAAQAHESAPLPPAVTVRAAEPAKDQGKKEVVLVDTSVDNYKSLEAGVRAGVGIVEFDGSRDGLAQIAQWAASQSGIDAIHILSHGSEGTINLGTARLTDASLSSAAVQSELAQLGQALSADGDLLLYGCDVAAGGHNALIADLARITGADVAASRDATGAAAIGGNWTLEAHAGKIDAKALDIADYQGLLTQVSFSGSDADYSSTTVVKQVNGQNVTFYGGASAGGLGIDGTYGTDGLYAYQGPTNEVRLTVTIASGYTFDISSFDVGVLTGSLTINLTYGNNTTDTLTVNSLANGWQTLLNSGLSKPINDVKQVVFSSGDFGLFQNFDITDVKAISHPPTVTVSSASLSDDTGTSGSDFITKTAAQIISGTLSTTLSTGEKVQVSYDNGSSWSDATTYTIGSSSWSTVTTLAGSSTFQARVTNADGSSTAYTHSYTLDTTAPTTSFTGISLSADTGVNSTDFITKTASQTITATLSGAPAGTDVVWGSVNGGASWTDVTSKVSGTTLTWNGATLGAGNSSIMLKVTDAAGNDSSLSFQNYTLDTTAPTTSVATVSFSADTGTSPTDFITKTAAQTISGTLSANLASGESVLVSLDNGTTWAAASATVGQNTWSLARTLSASSTLKVKVSDTAGNDGTVLSQAYTFDTSSPTITFNGLALSADTGSSASDFITKIAAQTIGATLSTTLAAGDIVYGSLDNGGSWTDITSKVSGTSLSWNGVTLAGSDTLQLKVVDAAGNTGSVKTQAYVFDTSTPATPGTPVLAMASDTGVQNNDSITSDTTPTLSGTAENGSTVTVFDGATLLGTVTAGAGGWTLTTGALAQGSHTITVVSTDTAGNASAASAALTIAVDTTAPAVATVAVPANGTYYSGGALDFTVNFDEAVLVDTTGGTPRIALVVGATTRYADYVSGSGTSALLFRYTVPSGDIDANGITVGALSTHGGTLRDTAGNDAVVTLNSVGSTAGVNVDGSNPSVTGVGASTADGAYGAGQTITITVDFSTAVNVDTTGGTPTLALDGGGQATYAGGSGTSTLTFSYTVGAGQNSADLDYSSSAALVLNGATIVDAGGANQPADVTLATPGTAGSLGANKDLVIDSAAPTNTVANATFSADTGTSGTDFITRTAAQTISGTLAANLAAGENVYVSLDNGGSWNLATASTGTNTWSLAGQTLSGSGTLKVRVTDAAGNNGTAYAQAYVLDTMAPTTSFSGIALSADTGASNTDLITNTAAQTISATLSGAPAAGDIVYGSLDNGATWTDITSKVSGTTLTWTGVTLAASDTLKLRVTDAAGNNGAATSTAYVLDTSAPATSVAGIAFSADSGASSTDFITNVAAQTVSGTLSANLASGERVLVSLDNGATWATAAATVGQNTWSLAGQTLTSSNTLLVKVADTAGNDGVTASQAYIYDTAAGVPTVATLATMSTTPVLSGSATLSAGETMTVSVGGATYAVVPAAGAWSLDLATAVPLSGTLTLALNQRYEVVASVTDLAGNVASDSSNGELTIGTLLTPPTTGITGTTLSADTGASDSDFITNVAAQTISGTLSAPLAAGQRVEVSLDGGASWRSAAATGGATAWSINVTLGGSGTLMARVSNDAGNGPAFAQAYVLDTVAPVATATSATLSGENVLGGNLSAPLAAGESVLVSRDGGASWQVAGVAGNSWSLAGVAAGQVQVVVRDTAGNNGAILAAQVSIPVKPPVVVVPPVVPPVVAPPVRVLPEAPAPADKVAEKAPASAAAGALPGVLAPDTLALFSPSSGANGGRAADVARNPLAPVSIAALTNPAMLLTAFTPTGLPELPSRSDALLSQVPIGDKAFNSGERIAVQLAPDTFVQSGGGTPFQLSAQQTDGRPLPAWLRFDSRAARFEGTAPPGFEGTLHFTVTARDAQGRVAVQTFKIVITRDGQVIKTSARDAGPADPVGRPGLSAQLGAVRGAGAERLAALSRSAAAAKAHA